MLKVVQLTRDEAERRSPRFIRGARSLRFGEGFYEEELEQGRPFRWMQTRGVLHLNAPLTDAGFVELSVASPFHDLRQELALRAGDRCETFSLLHQWQPIAFAVAAGTAAVELDVDRRFPAAHYPGDTRTLAIRVREPEVHHDGERHRHLERQLANAVRNRREMLDGATHLESFPPSVGIDLYGECNVKPPCVYCSWDGSKEMEGENVGVPFTRETLAEWGEFFDDARSLINCSIGEPFMMKDFDELLDIFGRSGKRVEITTNGQTLTDRNIERLVGREIELYISLDAGTPETYAKLRNDTFERILDNLRRLIAAKGGRSGLPRVMLVFMPMRLNVDELERFIELCAELEVDRAVLRPLNWAVDNDLVWERAGYRFVYDDELLPFDELVRVSGRAAALCEQHGVELSDQLDFGGAMEVEFSEAFEAGRREAAAALPTAPPTELPPEKPAEPPPAAAKEATPTERVGSSPEDESVGDPAEPIPSLGEEKLPICQEPWKSLYVLRRGILPCCYGAAPIADMQDYREAWNSPLLRRIRQKLSEGKFHRYCYHAQSCPLVRKAAATSTLPLGGRASLAARRGWVRLNRLLGGVPDAVYRPLKRRLLAARRRA